MNNELIIKKCKNCGAMMLVLEDCKCEEGCSITCCGQTMEILRANSTEASVEKHMPTYEIVEDKIVAKVNHVMEEDHYIKFITLVNGNKQITYNLEGKSEATAVFNHVAGSTVYEYCNKHGLWKIDID